MSIINLIKNDYTLQVVSLASLLLGIVSGSIGSLAVVRKESLLTDSISHASLFGIGLIFLVSKNKNMEVFLLGALLSGLLATFIILSIVKYSKVKFDTAIALILATFFGMGMVILTIIQKDPMLNKAGIEDFIFGQASSMLKRDVWLIGIIGIILISLIIIFWKEIKLSSFDSEYGEILGFSTRKINFLIFSSLVISIIIGLNTVGAILMTAMLTSPGVAARQWTDRLSSMVILAGVFGGLSGLVGSIVSSLVSNMPTGPVIVVLLSLIVVFSLLFSPKNPIISRKKPVVKDKKGGGI